MLCFRGVIYQYNALNEYYSTVVAVGLQITCFILDQHAVIQQSRTAPAYCLLFTYFLADLTLLTVQ